MTLLYLNIASFFIGLGISYTKFFLFNYISSAQFGLGAKAWIIQLVGALITVGPATAFFLSAPLAAAFRKRRVMLISGILLTATIALGVFSSWIGSPWLYVIASGLLIGFFNPARNACVPLEAHQTQRSSEAVNAWMNNTYIAGLLAGIPLGTQAFEISPERGAWPVIVIFLIAALYASRCKFKDEVAHLKPFKRALVDLLRESKIIFKTYPYHLSAVPILWGMAGALTLAATAYCEQSKLAGPLLSSLMAVYAAVGVALGNALSTPFGKQRYRSASLGCVIEAVLVLLVPMVVELLHGKLDATAIYTIVAVLTFFQGLFFGFSNNLLEAEYLSLVFNAGCEGTGAAILSASTALAAFTLGGVIGVTIIEGWLDSITQFVLLAMVVFGCALIVNALKRRSQISA